MGNTKSQARSASMANTPSRSRSTSTGTGGSTGNIGGGGGGQDSEYRRYSPPVAPTYTADTIDFKPVTGSDFQRSQNEFIYNLNINNASRFTPTLFNRTYNPVTLDTVGSRNQLPGLNSGLGAILGFATGIPFNLLASGKRGMKNVNNFMGNLREDLTGYRTQQEYDDARQNRINLKRINTIQNTLDRKYPDGDYSNTDLDERLADLKQSMGILDVATVNEVDDRPTQTFSFDNSGMKQMPQSTFTFDDRVGSSNRYMVPFEGARTIVPNPNFTGELGYEQPNIEFGGTVLEDAFIGQPTGIEQVYNTEEERLGPIKDIMASSDVAPEFRNMIIQIAMNEAQKKKALQEMGFGVPADKIIPKLQQLDDTKFGFFKTEDAIKANDLIKFYEDKGIKLSDDQKIKIIKAAEEDV